MKNLVLNEIRVALIRTDSNQYVRMGKHVKQRLCERGYRRNDIVSVILGKKSSVVSIGWGFNIKAKGNRQTITIGGYDHFNNPCAVVLSKEGKYRYSIITIMPPTDKRKFKKCIS